MRESRRNQRRSLLHRRRDSETIKESVDADRLSATTNFDLLKECDAINHLRADAAQKNERPDVSFILAAAEEIKNG